ncbi:MAG: hypothetical protein IJT04_03945 [Bacteroidales bacterium]|nr:hypothetical protein [Bacteroidales bacterium]
MKKLLIALIALSGFVVNANAELSQSELNKLTVQQRQIYLNQSKELNEKLKRLNRELFKAKDMIKMGQEMQRDNAKQAGAVHIMRGMELKEKATKEIEEVQNELVLLDNAARDAIKSNETN